MSRYVIEKKLLDENIELLKKKAGVPLIGVVKANGYGFGLKELTRVLKEHGIKTFAITEVEDIASLAEVLDGDDDLLVMRSTGVKSEVETIVSAGCIASLGSLETARVFNEVSRDLGLKVRCHIKVDTGLGRYGFLPNQVEDALQCFKLENLNIEGAYTHFSSAFNNEALTRNQFSKLIDFTDKLKASGHEVKMLHACNSPALFNVEGVCLDAVRIGSAFTGRIITRGPHGLHRVGHLEAEVVEVKTVPAGFTMGYNQVFKTKSETKIALVPVGTQDGFGVIIKSIPNFHSLLSSAKRFLKKDPLYVEIKGKNYPVLGEVDLSLAAVDVSGSEVKVGDLAKIDINPLMLNAKVPKIYC